MTLTLRVAAVAGLAAAAAYALTWMPRMRRWGATAEEAEGALPGDEVVGEPRYRSTHAVTIAAPPEAVWPWVVQLGQGRGGLYSYDRLENLLGLDIHSADRIIPELQHLRVGDTIRLVPEGVQPDLHFTVVRVEPPTLLVLGPDVTPDEAVREGLPYPSWTFLLQEVGDGWTRLVVRFQSDFEPSLAGRLVNRDLLTPVHFAMERRMLLGIRERAEREWLATWRTAEAALR